MNLRGLISPDQRYSFLAGAGISFDNPTNLPLAGGIVSALLDILNIEDVYRSEFKHRFENGDFRFEQFIEYIVRSYNDKDLKLFDHLAACRSPNRIHQFLANMIQIGHPTFTTNFDALIEQAGEKISCYIESIYSEESAAAKDAKSQYPLYKLHGTLTNEKGENRRESVVALISSIGKMGEAFALRPYFKEILAKTLQSFPLVVLGYSGSDDFDILPALAQIDQPVKIIWVHHSTDISKMEILRPEQWYILPARVRKVFDDLISFGNWNKEKITVLAGNTASIITEIEKILLPRAPKFTAGTPYYFPKYFYDDWKYEHAIETWRDNIFIASVYAGLGEYTRAVPILQDALREVERLSETSAQFHLYFELIEVLLRMGRARDAKKYLDLASELCSKVDLPEGTKSLLNEHYIIYYTETGNLSEAEARFQSTKPDRADHHYPGYLYATAQVLAHKGDYNQARSLVEEALAIYREKGNLNSVVYCLDYLANDDIRNENYRAALNSLLEAIRICELMHNFALLATCYDARARLFRKLGLLGKAFEDLNSANYLFESRIQDIHNQAICCAKIAVLLHQAEGIRKKLSPKGSQKIKCHYVEGFGSYYASSDMPDLFRFQKASLADGYVLLDGKKFSEVDANFSGLFGDPMNPSFSDDTSLGLIIEDEFPDETITSEQYAVCAISLAQGSGDVDLVEEVKKLVKFNKPL